MVRRRPADGEGAVGPECGHRRAVWRVIHALPGDSLGALWTNQLWSGVGHGIVLCRPGVGALLGTSNGPLAGLS